MLGLITQLFQISSKHPTRTRTHFKKPLFDQFDQRNLIYSERLLFGTFNIFKFMKSYILMQLR